MLFAIVLPDVILAQADFVFGAGSFQHLLWRLRTIADSALGIKCITKYLTNSTWTCWNSPRIYNLISSFNNMEIPHMDMDVRESLNATFPSRWIGHDGPICWPPRLTDLTLLDFCLWGYVKDHVFASPVIDFPRLWTQIRAVIVPIRAETL